MKWLIISTIVTIPFMFLLPSDSQLQSIAAQSGLNVSDTNPSPQQMLAETDFDNFCGNALLNSCGAANFSSVLQTCQQAFGNLTVDQCRQQCCNYNSTLPTNATNFFGIPVPS